MNSSDASSRHDIPDELIAEASVWVARLQGPNRKEAEHGVRGWLGKGADHVRAFELATEVWEDTAGISRVVRLERPSRTRVMQRLMAAGAAAMLLIGGMLVYVRYAGVSTGVGEQRVLTLEDGTRVTLNTATRLVVRYDERKRVVELKRGEALFDVAKRSGHPFIVEVGARQIHALGTSFIVRRDAAQRRVSITLVEGQVRVEPYEMTGDAASRPSSAKPWSAAISLSPGERLTLVENRAPALDRPVIDEVIAWRRGQIVLDDTRLADAVLEMNRYSETTLVVERPETGSLLVNGLFQTGDTESFAVAMAQTYGLEVVRERRRIVLAGMPRSP